jgi:hypothetical protein
MFSDWHCSHQLLVVAGVSSSLFCSQQAHGDLKKKKTKTEIFQAENSGCMHVVVVPYISK